MIKAVILAGGCSLSFFLVHVAIFAARRVEERFKTMNRIAVLFLAVYALFFWLTPGERFWADAVLGWAMPAPPRSYERIAFFLGVFTYAMLYIGYLEFYFTADRSMTVRILQEIDRAGSSLSPEQIEKVYDVQQYYLRRYDEMAASGYLVRDGAAYRVTAKGRRVARLYGFVIRFLHLEGG
jgi:hypothetical protein